MPWTRRMPNRVLAGLLARLSLTLGAGIDLRKAWSHETGRVPRRWRAAMDAVAGGIAAGDGLGESLARAGDAFPPVVRALVAVGDRTGRDAETLRDVAAALEHSIRVRRELAVSLVWPAFQLAVALVAIGVLIVVAGSISDLDGRPVDILGLGLKGMAGLKTYLGILAAVAVAVAILAPLAARSWDDRGSARRCVTRIPIVGAAVRAAEASAWCRAASLASHAGLDVGRLVTLASSAAPGLRIDAVAVESRLRAGKAFDEALRGAGRLPPRVLEAVAVGELTGTTAETLSRLAGHLDEEARAGFAAAARGVGFLAWAAVAGLIALVVFRFASFYVGLLDQAAKPL